MPACNDSDGELLRRARNGDQAAWEALVDRHTGRLWAMARAYRIDAADAVDIVQVAWMQLVVHLDHIRDPESVGTWLTITTRHECLRILRRRGREVPTSDDDTLSGADVPVQPADSRMLAAERQQAVWDALESLPPHCRRLLRLMMADPPPTYEEIMAALDMRQGSVGPTRRRCLDKLRGRLSDA